MPKNLFNDKGVQISQNNNRILYVKKAIRMNVLCIKETKKYPEFKYFRTYQIVKSKTSQIGISENIKTVPPHELKIKYYHYSFGSTTSWFYMSDNEFKKHFIELKNDESS